MTVACPTRLSAALDALASEPGAHVLAGGTDLMVEVNHGGRRPMSVVAVGRVAELREWGLEDDGMLRIGAGVTYTDLMHGRLATLAPGLAEAARTVGSPQIRNAGTIGGNLGTASPAGDTLPVLAALDAEIEMASVSGPRRLAIEDFITGPKRTALREGELITAVRLAPATAGDAQEYLKVGTRNAMVIAVASCAVIIQRAQRRVRVAMGSVGPRPLRASDAETWAHEHVDWERGEVDDPDEFGRLVARAALPIDDHRSTEAYRRHAVGVLARRGLVRGVRTLGEAAA